MSLARQRNLPTHVLLLAPFDRRIRVRRDTVGQRPAPRRPGMEQWAAIRRWRDQTQKENSAANCEPGEKAFHKPRMAQSPGAGYRLLPAEPAQPPENIAHGRRSAFGHRASGSCHSGIRPQSCPGGTVENSPAFQRWVAGRSEEESRRDGCRQRRGRRFGQPSLRDWLLGGCDPSVETQGYVHQVPPGLRCTCHCRKAFRLEGANSRVRCPKADLRPLPMTVNRPPGSATARLSGLQMRGSFQS